MKILIILLLMTSCCWADTVYEKVDKNTIKKTVTTETVIDIKKLEQEISDLEKRIAKEPDEILMPNFEKENLEMEKNDKKNILNFILNAASK